MPEVTTIKLQISTWRRLQTVKEQPGETLDDAVSRLLDAYERRTPAKEPTPTP